MPSGALWSSTGPWVIYSPYWFRRVDGYGGGWERVSALPKATFLFKGKSKRGPRLQTITSHRLSTPGALEQG